VPTGLISGVGSVSFSVSASGGNSTIRIVVNAGGNPNSSTAWSYSLTLTD
jgi:hypothetical protein